MKNNRTNVFGIITAILLFVLLLFNLYYLRLSFGELLFALEYFSKYSISYILRYVSYIINIIGLIITIISTLTKKNRKFLIVGISLYFIPLMFVCLYLFIAHGYYYDNFYRFLIYILMYVCSIYLLIAKRKYIILCIILPCSIMLLYIFRITNNYFINILDIIDIIHYTIQTIAYIMLSLWIRSIPQNYVSEKEEYRSIPQNHIIDEEGYYNIGKHIFLCLFTFGIWYYIWIYRTTKYLNTDDESPRNPTAELLLCMFIPFYYIYWVYKSTQRIDILAKTKGIPSDISLLCVILALFIGIIPPILMQDKINAIVTSKVKEAAPQNTGNAEQSDVSQTELADELKKYKNLLDSGLITQNEFEAKKKQLLDL